MRIAGWLVCLALVTSLSSGVVGVAGPAAADMPVPSEDPFYGAPAGYEARPDGTILRSRPVTATALSVPLPVDSWQLLYKSLDSHREPVADVATVLVPRTPWTGDGLRLPESGSSRVRKPATQFSTGSALLVISSRQDWT